MSQMIGELSHAAAAQSSGVSFVGDTVRQLDPVTQQNASLVEQTAAAESLRSQAAQLTGLMSPFRMNGEPALRRRHREQVRNTNNGALYELRCSLCVCAFVTPARAR